MYEDLWEQAEELDDPMSIDESMGDCFKAAGYRHAGMTDEEKALARYFSWFQVDFENTEPPDENSVMYFFPYNGPYVMEDYLIVDQRGYAHMLREIAKPFVSEIKFGQHVSKVEYSSNSVAVTTNDGSIYKADYVISTLPLGVMKHRDAPTAVTFDPPFPADKLAAIDEMGMGNYAKVYLQFDHNFWGNTETFAIAGLPIEGVNKYLTWGINLDHPKYLPGSKILSFHMASDVARLIESQPAEVTQVQIMKELRFLFGEDIPDPVAIK